MMLGIYEDTGNLTFPSTKEEDFKAAAYLLRKGANLNVISNVITKELSAEQIFLLNDLIQSATRFHILIAVGVAAMWGLSVVGGFGDTTGRSMWWGLLILPYLFGWLMAIWGPENPRWFSWLGIGVGLWYLVLSENILTRPSPAQQAQGGIAILVVLAALGILAMAGCIYRLSRGMKARAMRTNTTT